MKLEFVNIPDVKSHKLALPNPTFLSYKPDFRELKALWGEFGHFKNILIIGHGGSVTSFFGMYHTIPTDVHVKVLSTVDPDYIQRLQLKLKAHDTLVIAISKSGETVTLLESLMQFADYPLMVITAKGSTLEEIGKKLNARIVEHPNIGGRFTAFSEVALVPAAICGMNIEKIYEGAAEFFAQYREDNIAKQAAEVMFDLEKRGIVDVYMPFYSKEVYAFNKLIVQLCHESFAKNGKGQTYFAHEAPESQHHTNQRFFGGRKNIAGFFVVLDRFRQDLLTHIPSTIQGVQLRSGSLNMLNKIPLSYSMHAEYKGTWEDAKIHGIPSLSLTLDQLSPQEIGAFIAFWQLYAVYSALLREVDPFDQPEVESSKVISWNKRKEFRNI